MTRWFDALTELFHAQARIGFVALAAPYPGLTITGPLLGRADEDPEPVREVVPA